MKLKHLPNYITLARIAGAIWLIFVQPLSVLFFVVYSLCGLTDVVVGYLARKTNNVSEVGARLDSVADLLFYAVMGVKIFPTLWKKLPKWIWFCVCTILLLRVGVYVLSFMKYHHFPSLHTYLNKLSGLMIFLIPFSVIIDVLTPFCIAIAVVSFLAVVEELLIHLLSKGYFTDVKTLAYFIRKKNVRSIDAEREKIE
jgi:CDP-diacylglycerol--glycerol-3-phosphate 3-phosphatidyltransferase